MKVKILAVKGNGLHFALLLLEEGTKHPTVWFLDKDAATDEVGAIKAFMREWESEEYYEYRKAKRAALSWDWFTPEQVASTEGLELDLGGE